MPVIAGLDVATTTGIAVLDGQRVLHAEAFRPKGKSDAEIFHGFRVWLRAMLVSHEVQHVAIEQPLPTTMDDRERADGTRAPAMSMGTFLRLYGLRGHAIEICAALNIPCEEVHQATWRKAFLGNGRADKDMAVAQCRLLGLQIKSKDAAESVGIAWWLNGHLGLGHLARPGELALKVPA